MENRRNIQLRRWEFEREENRIELNSLGEFVRFNDARAIIEEINSLIPFIGQKVAKCGKWKRGKQRTKDSNLKPFKSGKYTNTVKGIILHPIINVPAFTFEEDDSYVECSKCQIIDSNEKFKEEEYLLGKYGVNWNKIVNG